VALCVLFLGAVLEFVESREVWLGWLQVFEQHTCMSVYYTLGVDFVAVD